MSKENHIPNVGDTVIVLNNDAPVKTKCIKKTVIETLSEKNSVQKQTLVYFDVFGVMNNYTGVVYKDKASFLAEMESRL